MLTNWVRITRVAVGDAEQLYPSGLDWYLRPGINAIVGGTGLGKTTLMYAIQFGVFDKLLDNPSERIDREFFRGRLTTRSPESTKAKPPSVHVEFSVGQSKFTVMRDLISGQLLQATLDGEPLPAKRYMSSLAQHMGLTGDPGAVGLLQSCLFFFGENRSLLAWDNRLQNEVLNLLFSEHEVYARLDKLWTETESADSEARNLSAQAVRLERDLAEFGGGSAVKELERRGKHKELSDSRILTETALANVRGKIAAERDLLQGAEASVAAAQRAFQREVDKVEAANESEDDYLLVELAGSPTVGSVRQSLEDFYRHPKTSLCPCCGRSGLPQALTQLVAAALQAADNDACVVCTKALPAPSKARPPTTQAVDADATAAALQKALLDREKIRSRIDALLGEEASLIAALADARERELEFLTKNPEGPAEPMRATIAMLRQRQDKAIVRRDKAIRSLRRELEKTNSEFERIQTKITSSFERYASLYLDEPCEVEFLQEDELPAKRGPQIKAPHAAFYPVISGQRRQSSRALSDAQRSFVDLAFRMAIIEVWSKQTRHKATLIVETPEGAVDIAYMERVAGMLREFAGQGHTLMVTTNLNNDIFLPEVLATAPKSERMDRVLNLLEEGRPRPVQKANHAHFERILDLVRRHRVLS